MAILVYTTFSDKKNWEKKIKKKFKNEKIISIKDKNNFKEVKYAIVWNLPNHILKQLKNLKIIFSMGAGVDHILNLQSYANTPIVRLKDPAMGERMANYVLSQILKFQLHLSVYFRGQLKNKWIDKIDSFEPLANHQLTVGILGTGFLGTYVANYLKKINYNVIGFKKKKINKKFDFQIFYKEKIQRFIKLSDIIVSVLPSTNETINFIDTKFLSMMKKNSLLINVGRGDSINEKDLIKHIKSNKTFFASLDVFNKEPLVKSHIFWTHPNVTVTPHIASITVIGSAIEQIYKRFLEYKKTGKIINDVNLKKGY